MKGISREDKELEVQLSIVLHSLRASRRRHVIQSLENTNEPKTTRQLSRQIAGKENGIDSTRVSGEQYKNVYNALSQSHLPTLTEAEVIVYDPQRQVVMRGQSFELTALSLNLVQPAVELFCKQDTS